MKESNRKLAYTKAHCKKSNEKLGATPGEHGCENAALFVESTGPFRIVHQDVDSVGHMLAIQAHRLF